MTADRPPATRPDAALARAAAWTAAGRYSSLLIQFGVTVALARLVTPSQFGLLAMAQVVTAFVNLIAEGGLNAAVVNEPVLGPRETSTVFWMAVGTAILLALTTSALAPALEAFFSTDGLQEVVIALSISFLFIGAATVATGAARRALRFQHIAAADLLGAVLSGIVAIVLAFRGAGVWALVAQVLLLHGVRAVVILSAGEVRPRFEFDRACARRVFRFSRWVTGFTIVNWAARNADNLLIGRALGATPLGYYAQAYRLLILPLYMLSQVIAPGIQPIFRRLDDPDEGRRIYSRMIEMIAAVSFPLGIFCTLLAPQIVRVLLGKGWEPAAVVFQILAPLIVLQPIAALGSEVLLANGHASRLFRFGALNAAIVVAGIAAGLKWGIAGVAAGYAISYALVAFPVAMYVSLSTLQMRVRAFAQVLARPALIAFCLGIAVLAVQRLGSALSAPLMLLVAGAAAGAVVFGFGFFFYRDLLRRAVSLARSTP